MSRVPGISVSYQHSVNDPRMPTPGARGFGPAYWQTVYADPGHIDGVGNATAHASYLKALFYLDMIPIRTVADFGCGRGELLAALVETFQPERALAVEPSPWALDRLVPLTGEGTRVEVIATDLARWCADDHREWTWFDLGVLNSVLQYLSDSEIQPVIATLAHRVRYLYVSVPTDEDYARMRRQTGFEDRWATARSKERYRALLSPHWRFVSSRLLESRRYADGEGSRFDGLFRF